ncbi:hypothetical protein HD599_000651 [Conyzicola lurida]|uniref:Uncharacterized protein n=1 Tax=Conyzicola lurida TaxID=1172621 RepID=A0A841AJ17_9MICO|nr:hypothetical protein [Conyzicola lurida]MBB5842328.1 hypothetical protein [Conyzicola lurida]
MSREALRVSPQRIDPLSWYTRPLVPISFGALALVVALSTIAATWNLGDRGWLDVVAIGLIAFACLLIQVWTRPLRPEFGLRQALVPLGLALAGLVLSTFSAMGSDMLVQHWWAPVGVGFIIATLGPFSSVRQVLCYGITLSVATSVCAYYAFAGPDEVWPPVSLAFIAGSAVVVATVATATFCFVVVSSTQKLLIGAGTVPPASEAASEEAARRVERRTLARLGNRVAPFLEGIAAAGEVTAADRALAGQLARQLRSDLVSQANRTWLDSIALFGRIYVVDPDNRADRMNSAQRTALRALLMGVIDNPAAAIGSLFIELRGEDDGSTAVALSLDFSLPEGRRAMMLAPYYLTLQTTVESLSWDPSRDLLRFQVPARGDDQD